MRRGTESFATLAALTVIILMVSVVVSRPALAHGGYPRTWLGSTVSWRFTSGFPEGGGQRDSVREGADQWTNTTSAIFDWNETAEVANWTISFDCGATWGSGGAGNQTINWKSIDGGGNTSRLGDTFTCPTSGGGSITKFWMRFDSDNSADFHWPGHPPDDPPIQSDEFDGWALASHEFGHATGFTAHIGAGTVYCDPGDIDLHTMCPSIIQGLARQRGLEVHDVDGFRAAY